MTDPSTSVNTSLEATNIINLTNLQLYKIFWTTLPPAIQIYLYLYLDCFRNFVQHPVIGLNTNTHFYVHKSLQHRTTPGGRLWLEGSDLIDLSNNKLF